MLLFNSSLLLNDPFQFFVLLVAVVVSLIIGISVHEFSHAAVANLQGDLTATRLGRLTLNPKAHLDPAGSIMLLVAGFGWGRPVPVNPFRLRGGRRAMALVSVAGPASNVVVALAFAALFQIGLLNIGLLDNPLTLRSGLRGFDIGTWLAFIGFFAVWLNLILAAFNLLPLRPLDGGGILTGIVPSTWLPAVQKIQVFGPPVLLAIIALSLLTDINVLGTLFAPVAQFRDILIG